MTDEADGSAIARERIAREALDQTGFLDLGRLGLTSLPEELFRLTHLRRLNLGSGIRDESGQWQQSSADLSPNRIEAFLSSLAQLPELEALSVNGIDLASLAPKLRFAAACVERTTTTPCPRRTALS
jgi:Leucine-rich repeat (LRR) protein